jgi:hypothetical protein
MMDAARLMPFAAGVLFLLPALWHPASTPEPDTAWGTVYLFAIWMLLIVAAYLLSNGLLAAMRSEDEDDHPPHAGDASENGGGAKAASQGPMMPLAAPPTPAPRFESEPR